jgi:hypothetical protein
MRIRTKGFKAADHDVTIGRYSVISAPNGAGKSTLADAIRFLALGFVPVLGRTLSATSALMSGHELHVELTLDDGRVATRTLTREGKAFTCRCHASWARGGQPEHEQAIFELFGSDPDDIAEMLDIRELLSMTPAKRAARIEQLIGSGGADQDLPVRVGRYAVARLLGLEPDQLPLDHREAAPNLPPGRYDALKAIAPALTSSLNANGIPSVIAWVNETKNAADRDVKHRRGALTELQSRVQATTPIKPIGELEGERGGLQKKLGVVAERTRHQADRGRQHAKAEADLARVKPEHDQAVARLEHVRTESADMIATCEARITEFDEQIGRLKGVVHDVHVDRARLESLEGELAGIVDEPVEDLTRYEKIIEGLEQELAGAKANPWAEVREIAEALLVDAYSDRAKRLLEIACANLPGLEEMEFQLRSARVTVTTHGDSAAAAAKRNLERAERRGKLDKELIGLRAQAGNADARVASRKRETAEEIDLVNRKRAAAVSEITRQRERVPAAEKAAAELLQKIAALQASVSLLAGVLAEPDETPASLEARIARIDEQLSVLTAQRALATEIDAIAAEIDRLEATVDVAKALEYALQRIREEELERRGGGLIAQIDTFLAGAGVGNRPYLEASKSVCDIGWIRDDGRRVAIQAMSGAEYSVFCAAITCAVLKQRGGELRVLLTEAAECDDAMLARLLAGIEATGDAVTHALVCSPHDPEAAGAWSIVTFGMDEAGIERANVG